MSVHQHQLLVSPSPNPRPSGLWCAPPPGGATRVGVGEGCEVCDGEGGMESPWEVELELRQHIQTCACTCNHMGYGNYMDYQVSAAGHCNPSYLLWVLFLATGLNHQSGRGYDIPLTGWKNSSWDSLGPVYLNFIGYGNYKSSRMWSDDRCRLQYLARDYLIGVAERKAWKLPGIFLRWNWNNARTLRNSLIRLSKFKINYHYLDYQVSSECWCVD